MVPRGAYRLIFVAGLCAFALSFASGFGWEVAQHHRLPHVQGESAIARSLDDHASFAAIQPRNPYAFVIWSASLDSRGDLDAAIEVLERGLELRPTIGPVHAGLADLYYRKGRFDDARDQVRIALRKGSPPDDRLLRQLGLERVR